MHKQLDSFQWPFLRKKKLKEDSYISHFCVYHSLPFSFVFQIDKLYYRQVQQIVSLVSKEKQ